jgi:hypothetical protein
MLRSPRHTDLVPVDLSVDTSGLAPGDQAALDKLLAAAGRIDALFLEQDGSGYYPPDMAKDEFERWTKRLSAKDRKRALGFFTLVRRDPAGKLALVDYCDEYKRRLTPLAKLLRQAAAKATSPSLARFLRTRADAFASNDYYESDVAWMEVDSRLDVTIGPYETYRDKLFGYKAAFEAYIGLRDDAETAKVKFFAAHLQDVEDNLPIDARHRNKKLGALAPIVVLNQIAVSGDGAHGIATAAFNLPNDDKVVREKGAKRVMLKNVQEAKFRHILTPIAARVLAADDLAALSFDSFFTHILAHELCHGLGPQAGVRTSLKEFHSVVEEAKADVTGLFLLQHMFQRGLLPVRERELYTTFLASSFRTLRFGIDEAHARGMAIQVNHLLDRRAFVARPDGTFGVDAARMRKAVPELAGRIMTIQAEGDYDAAKAMVERMAVVRPKVRRALSRLEDLPIDISPARPGGILESEVHP